MPEYPAIPDMGATFDASLPALQALRETVEIMIGARSREPTGQTPLELDARLKALEARIVALEARVTALE